jgi:hypothetical protein
MSQSAAASLQRARISRGDELSVERTDGRSRHGTFVRESEHYVTLQGTVGNDLGNEILIPRDKIMQITVVQRASREAF